MVGFVWDVPATVGLVVVVTSGVATFVYSVWKPNWWATLLGLAFFHPLCIHSG